MTPAAAEVRILGIRHHGPGSARSTLEALDAFRPDVVCIEGPPEAEAIAHLAADAAMTPPVALLAYDLDQPSTASFWPLASFSPEWQALRWAQRHGSTVRFVDLPAAHVLAAGAGERRAAADEADPLAGLAAAAGYDDVERWWDDLVEHSEREVFAALGEAMGAVREAAPPVSEDTLDGRREAHMRVRVRTALAEGADRVAVVCGAWHAPALHDLSAVPAEADAALLRGLPSVKVAMTWVPWSSRRLAAATGYGAGVRAPGWYHHLFTHAGPDMVARWFCEVAAVLRAGGYTVSPAQLIDATRLADALATMRRRTLPGLSEVTDAAAAVLGEGGSAPMALVHEELIVGTTVGSVPDDTPMVPLARDLAASQRRLRLKPEDRTLELDLRRPGGLARSHLLHRLALLDVPWGIPLEGRGAAGTFRETWRLRWEPELSVRLVERSAFGTTVEAAAAAYIAHLADGRGGVGRPHPVGGGMPAGRSPRRAQRRHAGARRSCRGACRGRPADGRPGPARPSPPLRRRPRYRRRRARHRAPRPRGAHHLRPRSRLHRSRRRRGRAPWGSGSRPPRPRSRCWRRASTPPTCSRAGSVR